MAPEVTSLNGKRIVCLSTIDWDFLWQGHQEIMSRFARGGAHVVFVENMGGLRTIRLSDAGRILRRLRRILTHGAGSSPTMEPRLDVVTPLLLPFPKSRLARQLNKMLLQALAKTIRRRSGSEPIVFSFLPSFEALQLVAQVRGPRSVLVYYCVADFFELAQDQPALRKTEAQLVRSADLVFVNSTRFAERFAPMNPRISYFPGGVSLEHFDPEAVSELPGELRDLPRPLIGYVGGLHQHLDLDLLRKLALEMPNASIVVIGPVLSDISALRVEPNIHLLGPRTWTALPSFVAAFDVGLIPYVDSPYTATVYPTKLFEYLAMGKPVVATDLPEVRRLELPEFAVRIASDHESFLAAVRSALAEIDESAPRRRRELAEQRDWGTIVARMAGLISEAVKEKARPSPSPSNRSVY